MQSLLGQFFTRIKGSQEDIASEGLVYILQHSKTARVALNKIVKADINLDLGDLNFSTQNCGDKLERPDITGYDSDGNKVLIIEAKFWASLTDNQPLAYFNLLHENSVLIFICPTLRVRPLYDELLKRINLAQLKITQSHITNAITFEFNKHLVVKTWDEILGTIRHHLVQDNEQTMISDIDQIIGLCNTIDNNSFLPIQSDDLSPKYAKRINAYADLVDKVVHELIKRGVVNINGLKATGQKYSYIRYFKTDKLGISLSLKFDLWAEHADTPFWVSFKEVISAQSWSMTNEFGKNCKTVASELGYTIHETNSREIYFALFPPIDKMEDLVINDLTEQIIKLIVNLEETGYTSPAGVLIQNKSLDNN
jgi:hypothetical protein